MKEDLFIVILLDDIIYLFVYIYTKTVVLTSHKCIYNLFFPLVPEIYKRAGIEVLGLSVLNTLRCHHQREQTCSMGINVYDELPETYKNLYYHLHCRFWAWKHCYHHMYRTLISTVIRYRVLV